MMIFARIFAAVSLAMLVACSSGTETATGKGQAIIETLKARKASKASQVAPAPVITRALLGKITINSLEAVIETTNQKAFLIPIAARNTAGRGKIVVWKSVGPENIILQNGVLIGTKGIGNDLGSVDASATVRALKSRRNTTGEKIYYLRRDDNSEAQIRLQCEITNVGSESIEVIERRYSTTHMREVCSNRSGRITNDFWVDSQTGAIRKSRQWGGPELGYVAFRLLKG